MRITAKLAYSQIKVNRSRTAWTLIGIILSTALITAVCSFAASANALLVDLFSTTYDENVAMLTALLFIPLGVLSVIIVAMAVIVISNAFRVSAGERRAQFGILKSVGTTKQQITATVMYESIFLSGVGIPIGVLVGLILTFAFLQVANNFLGELNDLVEIMMYEYTMKVDLVIAWQAIGGAILISFLTVLFSAWLPARKAAKVTAIDSIRREGDVKVESNQLKTSNLTEKIFGIEGALAAKNMKRSKRNLRASVISLTIGIVLFISLGSLSGQLNDMFELMFSYSDSDVVVDYSSRFDEGVNDVTGKDEFIVLAPINSQYAEEIKIKLSQFEGAVVFGAGCDMHTYTAIVPNKVISPGMIEAAFNEEKLQTYEIPVELIIVDSENYTLLCEQAGVPVGSNILLNYYNYNDNGYATMIEPFLEMENLQLTKADGSSQEIIIHGMLTSEYVPNNLMYPNTRIIRLIIPEGEMRGFSWFVKTDDKEGFTDYANTILGEIFPEQQDASYMEHGYSTRVFEMQDYMKIMNISIVLAKVFVTSFVILLALIGLTNVISTMSTNVQMRSREFAVLQSIGMTHDGLKRMLNLESIMCSTKALIIGLPIALGLTYLINMPIRSMLPVPYQVPWLSVLYCIIAVFIITWSTMWYSSIQLYKKNVIETIRLDN